MRKGGKQQKSGRGLCTPPRMFCVTKFQIICHIHQSSTLLTVSSKPRAAVRKEFAHLGLFRHSDYRAPLCADSKRLSPVEGIEKGLTDHSQDATIR